VRPWLNCRIQEIPSAELKTDRVAFFELFLGAGIDPSSWQCPDATFSERSELRVGVLSETCGLRCPP
jgi:hypothetical protein